MIGRRPCRASTPLWPKFYVEGSKTARGFDGFRLSTEATIRQKDKEIERLQGIAHEVAGYIAKQLEIEVPDKEHAADKLNELVFKLMNTMGNAN